MALAEGGDKVRRPPGRLLQSSGGAHLVGLFANFDRIKRALDAFVQPVTEISMVLRVQVSCDGELR